MTTAVSGLIKIGRTGSDSFQERMRSLEANGYYNVVGLKRYFAINLDDYIEKETLLHEVFGRQRIGDSELFALDQELVKQLLLSFEGQIIYPDGIDKSVEFDSVSAARVRGALFSFYRKGIKDGDEISFAADDRIKAKVVGEREVEYGGQVYKLAPLTYKLYESRNELSSSGAYAGADHFKYNGIKLRDLPDVSAQ